MSDNRQLLINMMQGRPAEYLAIDYSVDIKRNITIWRGTVLKPSTNCFFQQDFLIRQEIPIGEHSTFLPEYDKLCKKEKEIAATLKREEIVNAFLEFRKAHPRDGWGCDLLDWGAIHEMANHYKGFENGMEYDRADKKQLLAESIKREREFIKELWGVDLSQYPLDFDFAEEWERRGDELHRKFGWDKKLTNEEIWGRKIED